MNPITRAAAPRRKSPRQPPVMVPEWQEGQPQYPTWDASTAVRDGYKASAYFYACVKRVADDVASIPIIVGRAKDNEEIARIPGHPVELLLAKPNPFMGRAYMVSRMVIHLYTSGNALDKKVRGADGTPFELWPLLPQRIRPIPSRPRFIEGYEYTVSGKVEEVIRPENIIHGQFVDPDNPHWGMAPLEAAARAVDTDVAASAWNLSALDQRTVPDGILSFKHDLTGEQWLRARELWRAQRQGGVGAHGTLIFGNEAVWKDLQRSAVEMDFTQGRRFTREEICTVTGVPPPMVGILDHANYNNTRAFRDFYWENTVLVIVRALCSLWTGQLAAEWGEDFRVGYDLTNVEAAKDGLIDLLDAAKKLSELGYAANDINARLGLGMPETEWGETGYLPANLLPTGMSGNVVDVTADLVEGEGETSGAGPPGKARLLSPREHAEAYRRPFAFGRDGDLDEDLLTAHWKGWEATRAPWYNIVLSRAQSAFGAEERRVLAAWQAHGTNGGIAAVETAIDVGLPDWKRLYVGWTTAIADDFGLRTVQALYDEGEVNLTKAGLGDEETDPWVWWNAAGTTRLMYLQHTAAEKATLLTEASKRRVRKILTNGLYPTSTPGQPAEPLSVDQLARQLRTVYKQDKNYRAARLARTEVAAASNAGAHQGTTVFARQTNIRMSKVWISSRDARVRDSHQTPTDGQEVLLEDKFRVGPSGVLMDHPGDMRAPAGEVIHCRCACSYRQAPAKLVAKLPPAADPTTLNPTPPSPSPAASPESLPPVPPEMPAGLKGKAALEWLKENYTDVTFDFGLMAPSFVEEASRTFDRLLRTYPRGRERLQRVNVKVLNDEYAHVEIDGKTMNLADRWFGKYGGEKPPHLGGPTRLDWQNEQDVSANFHPKGLKERAVGHPEHRPGYQSAVSEIITHEFGHVVHMAEMMSTESVEAARVVRDWRTQTGGGLGRPLDTMEALSGYAKKNPMEAFAEYFTVHEWEQRFNMHGRFRLDVQAKNQPGARWVREWEAIKKAGDAVAAFARENGVRSGEAFTAHYSGRELEWPQ